MEAVVEKASCSLSSHVARAESLQCGSHSQDLATITTLPDTHDDESNPQNLRAIDWCKPLNLSTAVSSSSVRAMALSARPVKTPNSYTSRDWHSDSFGLQRPIRCPNKLFRHVFASPFAGNHSGAMVLMIAACVVLSALERRRGGAWPAAAQVRRWWRRRRLTQAGMTHADLRRMNPNTRVGKTRSTPETYMTITILRHLFLGSFLLKR